MKITVPIFIKVQRLNTEGIIQTQTLTILIFYNFDLQDINLGDHDQC